MNLAWLKNKGQSILEVILALAIFALFASAMVSLILGSFEALGRGSDYLAAAALADEGLEAARSIRDGAWNELTVNQSAVTFTSGEWQLIGEGTDEQLGKFHRVLTFSSVCRDSNLNLTTCPSGTTDLHSRIVKTVVDWMTPVGTAAAVERQTMMTNWDSRDWLQTDWSGGQYASVDPTIDVSVVGQISLKAKPSVWTALASTGTQTWNDIWMFSATDGFVVGSGGQIRRWNNPDPNVWNVITPVNTQNLNAVHCSSATNCFAVGASGTILRWNGSVWSLPSGWDTGNQTWNDVWAFGPTSGFVVGAAGEIWRHNGSAWVRSQDTGNQTWNALWMFSATDGVVAGSAGEIRRYNGSSWSLPSGWDTGNQTWNDVWMFSATDGVVVGSSGLARRFNGADWNTPVSTGVTISINAVYLSLTSGWAVGNNTPGELILSWDGASFSRVGPSSSLPNINLFGLHCASINDCFAVGASGNIFRLAGGGYEMAGSLISSAFDLTDPSPVQIIEWDEQVPVCAPACTIRFQIRAAADQPALAAAPWSLDFTVAAGALINPSYNGNRWLQYRVLLDGDGISTPVLNEVRINYK
ncbi:MAG: hypothetical protein HYT46_02535 [Candidatus Vogelbacteria bacterium]|nr:hypothetical protein [Candidatus Vogelbacteria bacterium]